MELIKNDNSQYEEYETLLLERDQVLKEAGQIQTMYILTFGQLIADVYEAKLECIKRKKIIGYYQNAINHGDPVDPDDVQEYLDQEMAGYYANLNRMIENNRRCAEAGFSSDYDVQQSKTIYRRLAKLIHPDINQETEKQEALKELWQRIVTAYGLNDVKALSELEVLVRKALSDLGSREIKIDIPDIEDRIDDLRREIRDITCAEPYIYKELLDSDEAVKKKKDELNQELKLYQDYKEELDKVVELILQSGEIKIKWRLN